MGKLVTYVSILVFIDIIFLVTGQLEKISPTSIILNAFTDPASMKSTQFYVVFLGAAGISAIASTGGVTTGIVTRGIDILAFTLMALALATMLGDFVTIYTTLNEYNAVLATILMAPLLMLFVVTIAEWLRGKD